MKKILFILALGICALGVKAQPKVDEAVKFDTEVHDFGKIKQGVPVFYDFNFRNISKAPITIANATASCGCTTPVKPEAPILPGKNDKIKAGFNAGAMGAFEKIIYITVEGFDTPKELKIKGEVVAATAAETDLVKKEQPKVVPAVVSDAPKPVGKTSKTTTVKKPVSKVKKS